MMKFIRILTISICLVSNILIAQPEGWFYQTKVPISGLNDVSFINENQGWAVGNGGEILYTTDAGNNWTVQFGITSDALSSISFINNQLGWVAGDNGVILKTDNGGISWDSQISGSSDDLYSVFFVNENIGWVCGEKGTILKTTNGGLNWFVQYSEFQNTQTWYGSSYFVDHNNGWIALDKADFTGGILRTTNGGDEWIFDDLGMNKGCFSIFFHNADLGWVGGYGIFLRTTNGGETWEEFSSITFPLIVRIFFTNENYGWVIFYGHIGVSNVAKTVDGGTNWEILFNSMNEYDFTSLYLLNHNDGWFVGGRGSCLGKIYKTKDGGFTLSGQYISDNGAFNKAFFLDPEVGWVISSFWDETILKTSNGGHSWINQSLGLDNSLVSDIQFLDYRNGWICGYAAADSLYKLFYTTNGGENWIPHPFGVEFGNKPAKSLQFLNLNLGWFSIYRLGWFGFYFKSLQDN